MVGKHTVFSELCEAMNIIPGHCIDLKVSGKSARVTSSANVIIFLRFGG